MKNYLVISAVVIFCHLHPVQISHAASVTFAYEGMVNAGVRTTTLADFSLLDALTGEKMRFAFSFDREAIDADRSPMVGQYPLRRVVITVGPYTFSGEGGRIGIFDDGGLSNSGDSFAVFPEKLMGPQVGDFSVSESGGLRLRFWDERIATVLGLPPPRNDIFFNDHLPDSPPNPEDFTSTQISLGFGGGSDRISFAILEAKDNITLSPVPLPSSLVLFSSGLLGLGGLRIKKFLKV